MSANRHLVPVVYTTLLKTHFSVVTDAVGELRFPMKSNKSPPTVNLVLYISSFSGFTLHNILPYVTFLSFGTCVLEIKITLFFPFIFLIPWANCPSSFAKYISQIFLSITLTRCIYFWATPDIWWVTALASLTFWNFSTNAKLGIGFFLPLDIKLELGPSVSNLGGCSGCTLFGGTGTSGIMVCGPEGVMLTFR